MLHSRFCFARLGACRGLSVLIILLLVGAARADVRTVLSSPADGPTILIATEPFKGDLSIDVALGQAESWSLRSGRVVVVPADELSAAIKSHSPSAVLVFRTVRSTKEVATVSGRGIDAKALAATLSKLIEDNGEPVTAADGDLAETASAAEALRVSLVVKKGGTNPAARSRMFRNALHSVLAARNMTTSDAWTLAQRKPGKINVAVYVGVGSDSTPGVTQYPRCLTLDPDIHYTFVGAMELRRPGMLDAFDAIVFPGGMSNTQARTIGEDGAKAVNAFVKRGGGYVGSCAGAYLASSGFDWSLGLLNSKVLDYKHWLRGSGDVEIELTDEGRKILGDFAGLQKVHYANGPLLAPAEKDGLTPFKPLAYFRSDMAKSAPGGVMPNTPAIIAGEFGDGRVLTFSPHPEYAGGLNSFISRAIRWTTRKPFVEIKVPPAPSPAEGAAVKNVPAAVATTKPSARPATAPAVVAPVSAAKQTPFMGTLRRNWSRWDADHDDVISVAEVNTAVADPANKGDDAAAAAALKLLARGTKVTEPMTKEYFARYNVAALPFAGTEKLTEAERDLDDPAFEKSPNLQARSKALPADWDLSFAKAKRRIARRGDSPLWPSEISSLSALNCMSQGPMGDCFFVACMGSAVAHRPGAIREYVKQLPDGKFQAKFPWAESFTFPALTDAQVALSSSTTGEGAWLAVMEQAFGKYRSALKGGSSDIDGTDSLYRGGDSAVTIGQLTGHATRRIRFPVSAERRAAEKEAILPDVRRTLIAAMEEHRLITAGVDPPAAIKPGPDGKPSTESLPHLPPNINKNHVYAIVSYDAKTDVIEMWNPHGQTFEPKGKPGLENGYVTTHGRFKLPLAEAYSFYTSFTFELSTPATRPAAPTAKKTP